MKPKAQQLVLVPALAKRAITPERKAYVAVWQAAHRDCEAARQRAWRAAHPEQARAQSRRYQTAHPETSRTYRYKTRYGLTKSALAVLFDVQKGCCGICQKELKAGWHVDHDHATGRVRGLLCRKCNTGIGMLGDDPTRLLAGVAYLRKGNA